MGYGKGTPQSAAGLGIPNVDIPLSLRTPTTDEIITAGYSAIVAGRYTIASAKRTTIGLQARLKVV